MEADATGDGVDDGAASTRQRGPAAVDLNFMETIRLLFQDGLTGSRQASKRLERFNAINALHTRMGQKWLGSFVDTPVSRGEVCDYPPVGTSCAYRDHRKHASIRHTQSLSMAMFSCTPVNDVDSDGTTATNIQNWQINLPTGSRNYCLGPYSDDGTLSPGGGSQDARAVRTRMGKREYWKIFRWRLTHSPRRT